MKGMLISLGALLAAASVTEIAGTNRMEHMMTIVQQVKAEGMTSEQRLEADKIAPASATETANASCIENMMAKVGLLVEIDIKPELAAEFEGRLRATLPAIEEEPGTLVWFAIRLGPAKYAVVDVFPDDASRQEHLDAGRVRLAAIKDLFASPPRVTPSDVIAAKLPSQLTTRDCKSAD